MILGLCDFNDIFLNPRIYIYIYKAFRMTLV